MILLTVVLIIIACIYLKWMQVKQYWSKRKVPHLPPHPLMGNMTFLVKQNAALWMRSMYEQLKTPYIGIWIFWRPGLLVNSRDIAKRILMTDSANFRNRFATSGTTDPVGSLNLFSLKDPLWSQVRRRLTVFFSSAKLRGLQVLMTAKSKELVQRIDNDNQKTKYIELRELMTDYTTDVIGTSVFGVVCDATLTGKSAIRTITKEFMKFSLYRGLCWCSAFFIPELVDVLRFKVFPKESIDYLRRVTKKIIEERGGYETKVTDPRDLLDILIKIKQETNKDELDFTDNMLLAQATIFLQGGFDTSASTLAFCIYELAYNKEIQDTLFKELQEASEKHGDGLLDANILSRLTYLNCVINETLRKYPIISYLDRMALKDYKVDDHLSIKAGTPVFVNMMALNYNPEVFPEPDIFNPDRFLPENVGTIDAFDCMPFGEGPRKCIGQRFGLSTVRHALAAVILNYEARVAPNSTKPSDLLLDKMSVLVSPGEKLLVQFVSRSHRESSDEIKTE